MLTPISVVIPLHNRADLASQCLASLARWTTPLEILVVDDGSTDPGVELLRRAGLAHQWLRHPQALGFSAAVNRGLAHATGDPLLLLNSDAEVTEGGDHLLRAALTESSTGAVAARLLYPDGRPQWSGGAFPSLTWLFALASGLGRGARFRLRQAPPSGFAGGPVDWAPGAALAMSRATWSAIGAFDETYRHYAQDLDYCQRLAASGRGVRVLADWVVVHHLGGSLGQASGEEGQQLDLLWLDLLHWARRHRGAAWARRARAALLAGGRLRLLRLARQRASSEAIAVASAVRAVAAATAVAGGGAMEDGEGADE